MKIKKTSLLLIVAAALILAVSCSTSVAISTWAPSTSGIAGYKTIAIRETTAYTGRISGYGAYVSVRIDPYALAIPTDLYYLNSYYDTKIAQNVAKNTSGMLQNALSQSVFTVYNPTATEGFIATAQISGSKVSDVLKKNGVELLLTSKIDNMDYNEYITIQTVKDAKGVITGYNFYLNQSASVTFSVMVQDVESLSILWQKNYSKKTNTYTTKIGFQETNGLFKWISRESSYSVEEMFNSMIRTFSTEIKNALTPHRISTSFELMENKKNSETMKKGLEYADDRNYGAALAMFQTEWEATQNMAAGYNMAVMYFALAQYDNAVKMAETLWNQTGSPDVYELLANIKSLLKTQQAAIDQINGEKTAPQSVNDLIL